MKNFNEIFLGAEVEKSDVSDLLIARNKIIVSENKIYIPNDYKRDDINHKKEIVFGG